MATAPEIPADVMAAARVAIRNWSNPGDRTYPLEDAVARAILAERRRCMDAVNAEHIMDADENLSDADPTDIAYDTAIDHAIDAIKRLSA